MTQTTDKIIEYVAGVYGVTADRIMSNSRKRTVVEARQMAMYLLVQRVGLSMVEVANLFNRTHPTVSHSITLIGYMIDHHAPTNKRYEILKELMK